MEVPAPGALADLSEGPPSRPDGEGLEDLALKPPAPLKTQVDLHAMCSGLFSCTVCVTSK